MNDYLPMLQDTLGMFLFLGAELSLLFLLISFGVSLLQQYIPESRIQSILSGQKGRGYFFAALLGAVTPFCSCSTIPMLRGLLKARAGFGPTMTFLFVSPLLNPLIVGLFLVTFGFQTTLVYSTIALVVSVIASVILDKMDFERFVIPEGEVPQAAGCCSATAETMPDLEKAVRSSCCASDAEVIRRPASGSSGCCSAPVPAPKPAKVRVSCCGSASIPAEPSQVEIRIKQASKDAWVQFKGVLPYLLVGVLLGSFVYGFVPGEFIAKYASGDNLLAVPIAALIGVPLYVRAETLIPLSAALAMKGMGLGAIMALIIGGSGASLTEVILLKSMFRIPMIVAFLTVILGMAIFAGYLFQFVL